MKDLTIRPARPDEIDAIYAVHRDSVSVLCTGHYTPQQIAMWPDGRTADMYLDAIGKQQLWVALGDDGTITGFVEVDGTEISKLFVRGDRAAAGVGRRLLASAVAAIRATGAASVYLEATRNACDFYRKHGFVEIGTGEFSRGNGGVALEIVKMELELFRSALRWNVRRRVASDGEGSCASGSKSLKLDVIDPALCTGCGACGLVCPEQLIRFDPDRVEPRLDFDTDACGDCDDCHAVCPGRDPETAPSEQLLFGRGRRVEERWLGIYREVYGARSRDPEIVGRSASGGTVTTLLIGSKACLGVEHVLTMGRDRREGWRARGEVASDVDTIVENAQSTYQLAPYLTALRAIFEEQPDHNVAVAGLACHMQAIRKMQRQDTAIGAWARDRIVALVELACSSNTLPAGTSSIITDILGLHRDDVIGIKYREGAYPGRFQVTRTDRATAHLEFWETLEVLKANKTHRCLTCGDWMSGLADVSVCDGDPNIFQASLEPGATAKHGRALIRTERGRELWQHCIAQGLLEAWPIMLHGFNLGLERKRNRRRHYERLGGPLPAGPGVDDVYDASELRSDEELIDPAKYRRGAR